MKRESKFYLDDILTAIGRIKEYVGSTEFDMFVENQLVIDATLRNLEIIGEAAAQLPDDFKAKHVNIAWRDIKDFRNVVAHKYFNINLEIVWDIIEHKLQTLEEDIIQLMNNL